MSLLLLLSPSGPSAHGAAITDTGATVTDSLRRRIPRTITDTGATVTDVVRRTTRKTLTDTGATISDSIALVRGAQQRSITDRGALISETIVISSATGTIVGRIAPDSYADGASAIFGQQQLTPLRISLYGDTFTAYSVPTTETDPYYARLPLDTSQDALASGPSTSSVFNVYASWHGALVDPERGSFAVVRAGGELEDLIGDRVRVTTRVGAAIAMVAYVNNVSDIAEDTEISLTRRLFLQMAPLGLDRLPVTVEVIT